ncbi:SDR family NAD(P)-dependent oxidoreductase [Halalkalibacillus halophilus]|uniref:SDR family NAD(P)-dependent oxidoreductase n=1 Tax=Halalkalibacillus halophilus TaxID=392827 RepID=UPI000401236E|nr:SDR family NAD(P)-dependent oxidoreductase [Halalkalibacillus halophilus]
MNIFLTGATGFLGTNLTKRFVKHGHHVYVMVRNERKLAGLFSEVSSEEATRIHVVPGDLLVENLGITSDKIMELQGNMDVVYHTAAYLSFDESERERVFSINLTGTERVLELSKTIDAKRFVHVSTAYTLGNETVGSEELHPTDATFINAYEESKCQAEHLVMSKQAEIEPIIVRPAIIIGDSVTGEADTTFGLYGILRTVALLKKIAARKSEPENKTYSLLIEAETTSNLVPVDFVIDLLYYSLKDAVPGRIYHATNPNPPTNGEIFDAIRNGLDFHQVKLVSYEHASELTEEEWKMNQPLEVFKSYLNRSIVFKRDNTEELLSRIEAEDLQMTPNVLQHIIEGFQKSS